MNFKKIIITGITSAIFIFCGCDLTGLFTPSTSTGRYVHPDNKLEDITGDNSTTTNNYRKTDSNSVFFVQMNNTDIKFDKNSMGCVSKKSSRAITANEQEIEEELPIINNEKDYYHEKVQQLNEEAFKYLKKDNSRAANNTRTARPNIRNVGDNVELYIQEEDVEKSRNGICKAVGNYCNIIFVNNTTLVSDSDIDFNKVAEKFDSIYQKETAIAGSNIYISTPYNNIIAPVEKIDIIIADLIETATANQTSGTFGYFWSKDCLTSNDTSNKTQCIYIDSYFLKKYPKDCYSTLVHEFNHLLNFCQKTCLQGLQHYDTWYTEMMAMTMEDLFQHQLEIDDKDSPKSRLPNFNYGSFYGFTDWPKSSDKSGRVYYNYANAYAFGAYLVRNFGGVELLKEIATNNYLDEESITKALKKTGYNIDFDTAIRYFPMVMANLNDGNSNNLITLNRKITYQSDSTLYFDAIDLMKYYVTYKKQDNSSYIVYGPNYCALDYVRDLYPSGFYLVNVGKKTEFVRSTYEVEYKNPTKYPKFYTYFVNYNKNYVPGDL